VTRTPEKSPPASGSGVSSSIAPTESPAGEPAGPAPPAESTYSESTLPENVKRLAWPEYWSSPAQEFSNNRGAYRYSYERAFDNLSREERYTIRDWTHVEGSSEVYVDNVDGQQVADTNAYTGMNYALNSYLRGKGFDPNIEIASDRLHNALSKLPKPPGQMQLLRVSDVEPGYADKFQVGDYVTNGRPFMSASSDNAYAVTSFQQGYAAEGQTGGMAIYEIQSKSATPMLQGKTTLAEHESEWIFTPNTIFQVEGKNTFVRSTESDPSLTVTALRLNEVTVTQPLTAKNIHTGEPVRIGPEEQLPPPLTSDDSRSEGGYYSTSSSDSD